MNVIKTEGIEEGKIYFFVFKPYNENQPHRRMSLSGKVLKVEAPFVIIKNDFKEKEPILIDDVTIYEPSAEFLKILND